MLELLKIAKISENYDLEGEVVKFVKIAKTVENQDLLGGGGAIVL